MYGASSTSRTFDLVIIAKPNMSSAPDSINASGLGAPDRIEHAFLNIDYQELKGLKQYFKNAGVKQREVTGEGTEIQEQGAGLAKIKGSIRFEDDDGGEDEGMGERAGGARRRQGG